MRWAGFVVVAVVLAACAHTPDLPLRPDPAPPVGSTTSTFKARDGTELLARAWAPTGDSKVVRGVVVIMHGLKDYSGRYAEFAAKLALHGYLVYAFDLRGHGRSAGPRVAPDRWTDYVEDLDRFLARVENQQPGKPVFLFGHSMGGAIAARTAEVHQPKLAGLVLSGAALAVDAPPLLVAATAMVGVLSPGAAALKLDNHDFSSDPANAAAMDQDELIEQGPGPARTAAGLVDGMRLIWQDADELTMPVLALHGTSDRLTAPSGSRALIERVPATDKTLSIYPGYFHDLLHEPNGHGAEVAYQIIAWLDAHTGGQPFAPAPIYDGELGGDPRGWTQAIDLDGGYLHDHGFVGRFAIDVARPRPIGWYGSLTGFYSRNDRSLALRPLGLAVRYRGAAIGAAGGLALVSGVRFAYSGGGWIELPVGPIHLGGFVEYERTISDAIATKRVGGALRFGGDRDYWPQAHAGVGPVLVGGTDCTAGCSWFVMTGLELYGAD